MNPVATFESLQALNADLNAIGSVYEPALMVAAVLVFASAFQPQAARWRGWILTALATTLMAGEAVLIWYHWRLYRLAEVVSPDGVASGRVAVPLWIESEKLFVWALLAAVLGTLMRRQRKELLAGVMVIAAGLTFGAAVSGRPFTNPVPGFLGQYTGYLQAMASQVPQAMQGAYDGMEGARQGYYNAWYMWVHPPMLFLAYGCFAISFVATLHMISSRHSSFETTAYRWARFGYVWLTLGMLLGFPWALSAWQGESWWWTGKVNMSLMMWLLYTAYLHARLYLRRKGMWKAVAALAVLSFAILVLTYATTYIVPGAHSYANANGAPSAFAAAVLGALGGGG